MAEYQLKASDKWSFDFIKESPIACSNSQFKWQPSEIIGVPPYYHHIAIPSRLAANIKRDVEHKVLFNEYENIFPLAKHISSLTLIIQNPIPVIKRKIVRAATTSLATKIVSSNQGKITGERFVTLSRSIVITQTMLGLKLINPHREKKAIYILGKDFAK